MIPPALSSIYQPFDISWRCSEGEGPPCRGTPTLLYTLAIFGVAAAATLVYLVPDNSFGEVAVQLVGAGVLVGAGGAAFYGGNLISSLQKAI